MKHPLRRHSDLDRLIQADGSAFGALPLRSTGCFGFYPYLQCDGDF